MKLWRKKIKRWMKIRKINRLSAGCTPRLETRMGDFKMQSSKNRYPGFSLLISFGRWGRLRFHSKRSVVRLCLGFFSVVIAFRDLDAMLDDPRTAS